MSAQHTPGYNNEDPEVWRRRVIAAVISARSAHRTALLFVRRGYPAHFVSQARSLRDADLASARSSRHAYRASIAKATGSAS